MTSSSMKVALLRAQAAKDSMPDTQIELILARWLARGLWDDDVPDLATEILRLRAELLRANDKIDKIRLCGECHERNSTS